MSTDLALPSNNLAIGIGSNLPSEHGNSRATLVKARQLLNKTICLWLKENCKKEFGLEEVIFNWSSQYETYPVGNNLNQPKFINAIVLVKGNVLKKIKPSKASAFDLLKRTMEIEKTLGRVRGENVPVWGPRIIDIDLLAWGNLSVQCENLILPHPRLLERNFVITPLSEVLNQTYRKPIKLEPITGWDE